MNKTKSKYSGLIAGLIIAVFAVIALGAPASAWTGCDLFTGDTKEQCMKNNEPSGDSNTSGTSFSDYQLNGTGITPLTPDGLDTSLTKSGGDLKSFIIMIVNFALGFLGLIAVIIVIYGGVLYVTAAGEDTRTGKAKKAIGYAAVGLLIVLASFAIVNTIISSGGGNQDQTGGDNYVAGIEVDGAVGVSSFRASAEQVKTLVREIYNGFMFLAESTQEIKNIVNDASKQSISPTGTDITAKDLPNIQEIQNFLQSFQQKLKTMEGKLPPFSAGKTALDDLQNKVAQEIDYINTFADIENIRVNLPQGKHFSAENIEYCLDKMTPPKQNDAFNPPNDCGGKYGAGEKDYNWYTEFLNTGSSKYDSYNDWWCSEYAACDSGNFYDVRYPKKLYREWENFRNANIVTINCNISPCTYETSQALKNIESTIAQDYKALLMKNIGKLKDVWAYVSMVEAIGSDEAVAKKAWDLMLENFGDIGETGGMLPGDALVNLVNVWTVDSDVNVAGTLLLNGMEASQTLYSELLKIKFVNARLAATAASGKAPLVNIFNVSNTSDPAGGSIKAEHIVWDLSGQLTIEDLQKLDPENLVQSFADNGFNSKYPDVYITENQILPSSNPYLTCDPVTYEEITGPLVSIFEGKTVPRCIYRKPGTYSAAVLITSNTPTKYGPGISILKIKVNPPATEINLKVNGIQVTKYNNGVLITDLNEVGVTLNEAQSGIAFDAGETDAQQYKWNFGDGETQDFSTDKTPTHNYDKGGKYEVTLEVLSKLGAVDKKIFTLNVRNVVARMIANPANNANINEIVVFDGSGSKSDTGPITQYHWEITPVNPPAPNPDDTIDQSGAGLKTLSHIFKHTGTYTVKLTVTNGVEEAAVVYNDPNGYTVKSKPPVAMFDYSAPDINQPAEFNFDASKTYDPDGPNENLKYSWTVDPGTTDPNPIPDGITPVIKFNEKGQYKVTLTVTDTAAPDELGKLEKTLDITDVLDIKWGEDQQMVGMLNSELKAPMSFNILSEHGKAYEIDFGDSENVSGNITGGFTTVSHDYTQEGNYLVTATVYDEDNNEKSIKTKVFIGGGNKPIARINLFVNDVEINDLTNPITVSRKDVVKFDAGQSMNKDGTSDNLKYSWNFGDNKQSSEKTATHIYKELNSDTGYLVTLTVFDNGSSASDSDSTKIKVASAAPKFSAIQGLATAKDGKFITPVVITMKAYNAQDPDGEIVQYKWWYFDVNSPDDELGFQTTTSPTAQLTMGTKGKEGDKVTYGFGLEVTDNDGLKYSSKELYSAGNFPKFTVTNGPNKQPVAKLNVSRTSIFTGEKIVFTSASTDADGKIVSYSWDYEGDGFFNNPPTDKPSVEYTYKKKNLKGYPVKLKVVDNAGAEAVSDPINIYVDSNAKAPSAAFKSEPVGKDVEKRFRFINNSKADEKGGAEIAEYKWDFDTDSTFDTADGDGDGIKDNDANSKIKEPQWVYEHPGVYHVKLTITDSNGETDSVTNAVNVAADPQALPPIAAFKAVAIGDPLNGNFQFTNNSKSGETSGVDIVGYKWDFDTDSEFDIADSDGDGIKNNDTDSIQKNPQWSYKDSAAYKVKLTVLDSNGKQDDVVNIVNFNVPGQPNGTTSSADTAGTFGLGDISDNGVPNYNDEDPNKLTPILTTIPVPDADTIVYLYGDAGYVTFNFAGSTGPIATYSLDKNIYLDSNKDGVANNDEDFKTTLPGTWKTNFEKAYGKTVVKLTVTDIYGNSSSTTVEIKFK